MVQKSSKNNRMNKTFNASCGIIAFLIIFSSCSTSKKLNEQLLIGSWNRNKIVSILPKTSSENYSAVLDSLGVPAEVTASKNEADRKVVLVQGRSEKSSSASDKEDQLNKLQSLFPDFKDVIEFKADKTCTIVARKGTANGTWDLNGKGNLITLNIQNVATPVTLSLVKIDASTLEIVDHFPSSDVQIGYLKK